MVAKCANPNCNREFRELSKGKLFLLPPVSELPFSMGKQTRLIDHCYWLCPDCAKTFTMALEQDQPVIREIMPFERIRAMTA